MPNPPDRFESFVDLTGVSEGANTVTALNTLWASFYSTYGVYPNSVVTIGNVVYVGAYSD
jgi:hypothetical protein